MVSIPSIRHLITLLESAEAEIDLARLTALVTEFRDRMEAEPITDRKRAAMIARAPHYRFFGQCNDRSRDLVAFLRQHGFPAETQFGGYRIDDPKFIENHGSAIRGWDEGEHDDFPDEEHEWVQAGPYYVDVTADQFHPSNPTARRVVVVHRQRDRHPYR